MARRSSEGRLRWVSSTPADLAAALRAASDDLPRLLADVAKRADEHVRQELPAAVRANVPNRGGLADDIVRGTTTRTTVKESGGSFEVVTFAEHPSIKLYPINRGRVKHPTFGGRPWVVQTIPGGFWTEACRQSTRVVTDELIREAERLIERLAADSR